MTDIDERLLFELSTEIAPPKVFAVDGAEYRILGLEHIGREEEARVVALFARHTRLNERLDKEVKQETSEKVALAIHDTRMSIITALTDLPRDVAEKLPHSGQVKLLRFIAEELGGPDDDEETEVGEGGGDPDV